jgi:hypothetical protein
MSWMTAGSGAPEDFDEDVHEKLTVSDGRAHALGRGA